MTHEEEVYWPAYSWADNPWILDQQGSVLTSKRYSKIRPCTIAELKLHRIEVRTYSFVIPTVGATTYQQAKLRRWGLAILLSAPSLSISQELQLRVEQFLRHPPNLTQDYTWTYTKLGCVSGIVEVSDPDQRSVINLEQNSDGIHWSIAANSIEDQRTAADCQLFQKENLDEGIVFSANPLIHGFPWSVPETIANMHVLLAIKKQVFRRYKGLESKLSGDASRFGNTKRVANTNSSADANSSLGSQKRAHFVPSSNNAKGSKKHWNTSSGQAHAHKPAGKSLSTTGRENVGRLDGFNASWDT